MKAKKLIYTFPILLLIILTSCTYNYYPDATSKETTTDTSNTSKKISSSTISTSEKDASSTISTSEKDVYDSAYQYISTKCYSSDLTLIYSIGNYQILYQNKQTEIRFNCLLFHSTDSKNVQFRLYKEKPKEHYVVYARHSISSSASFPFGNSNKLNFIEHNGYTDEYKEDFEALRQGFSLIVGGFIDYIFKNSNYTTADIGL